MYSPMDDAGFPVKAEEFVVLSQEPSVTETIAPKIARPFIEVRARGAGPIGMATELSAQPNASALAGLGSSGSSCMRPRCAGPLGSFRVHVPALLVFMALGYPREKGLPRRFHF